MNRLGSILRREWRVAVSPRAQPAWFRILKWTGLLGFVAACHDRPWFGRVILGCTLAALAVHFLYRWKTRAWTRAWGGWKDLAAGRD
jgi:hypothetical protein